MKAFKGFNKNLKCRDFQYEIGKNMRKTKRHCAIKGFTLANIRWTALIIMHRQTADFVKLSLTQLMSGTATILRCAVQKSR